MSKINFELLHYLSLNQLCKSAICKISFIVYNKIKEDLTMSSAQITLPKNTWVQATTTDKSGSVTGVSLPPGEVIVLQTESNVIILNTPPNLITLY